MVNSKEITDRILQNSLVLENVCQHLSFKDHLKLMLVSEEFRDTLQNFVWRSLCKDLVITERNDNYLLRLNGSDYCIMEDIFKDFLKLNKKNVGRIQLRNCSRNDILKVVETFKNLSILEFQYCQILNSNMETIAKNCLALRVLMFDRCTHSCNTEIVLGRDIKTKTLLLCPSLKELAVLNRYKVKMNYETIQEIFKELRLSKLTINTTIIYEGSDKLEVHKSRESLECLNDLNIGRFSNRASWTYFIKMHLPHFRNLKTLSIFIDLANCVLISDAVLATISRSCPFLCELFFKQCKFQALQFTLPSSLQHISLEWCWGVTWRNLKQILTQDNLKAFTTINGHFNGDNSDFIYCTDTLETFTLETSLIKDITSILYNFKSKFPNVKSLNWLNSSESCHIHPLEIRSIQPDIFPKLQQLRLEQSYLCSTVIEQLQYLKVFQFSLFYHMTWSYLFNILLSQSLTHLTIDMPATVSNLSPVCPILHLKTKITSMALNNSMKFIKIPLEIFRNGLAFWLDYLNNNANLKLMFYINYSHKIFNQKVINEMLNHEKFPPRVRSIKICNKIVGCDELRVNFGKTMKSFDFFCNEMGQYFVEIT